MNDFDPSSLRLYLKTLPKQKREEFALDCGTTLNYLNKRISIRKPFGYQISKKIAEKRIMTPEQLRPADYQNYTWI